MKGVVSLILCLLVLVSFDAKADAFDECRSANANWYSCDNDSDCVVVLDPCGWPWESANKQFSQEAEQCNVVAGSVLGCVRYGESMGTHTPKCVDNVCVGKRK